MRRLVVCILLLYASPLFAQETVRIIIERPEERKRTNRSLSEWLKLTGKATTEDFRWFFLSQPQKDSFRPELHLQYGQESGVVNITGEGVEDLPADIDSASIHADAKLWLTNILMASTGLRTLNVDFGLSGFLRNSGKTSYALGGESTSRVFSMSRGGVMFRLFGKHIQDSSLTLSAGQYEVRTNLIDTVDTDANRMVGNFGDVELCLYLFKFLGGTANYSSYQPTRQTGERLPLSGTRLAYGGFLEFSLLRIAYGVYKETWNQEDGLTSEDTGTYISGTLLL